MTWWIAQMERDAIAIFWICVVAALAAGAALFALFSWLWRHLSVTVTWQ